MKILISILISTLIFKQLSAQIFIDKGEIEFEVKTNITKTLSDDMWGEMIKDNSTKFKTGYFHLIFDKTKSIYQFDHWDPNSKIPLYLKKSDEECVWFFDYANNKFNKQQDVWGSKFNIEDSIPVIQWRLTNDSREIAGFNCRKAVGKIMDSVYVFAFYTDEIAITGGPCSISGLPGMILGLTIPRMYTSFIATKINVNNVDASKIKPVYAKKYLSQKELVKTLNERRKEWVREDDSEDDKKWVEQFFWRIYL